MQLAFCRRNAEAARADLVRICAEIREELEPEELPLAVASALAAPRCRGRARIPRAALPAPSTSAAPAAAARTSAAPSAELQIVRRALGDVPLVGFFAGGEIARSHLYGYTGVLTVFRAA